MESNPIYLTKVPLLKIVSNIAKQNKREVYLVGGFLRDLMLGRKKDILDLDFSVDKEAINLAKKVAKKLRASFVLLDKKHGSSRVVLNRQDKQFTLDFTDFRGPTIKKDLFRRDFTINTLAVNLADINCRVPLSKIILDPYSAIKDLNAKIVRMVSGFSFKDDPLRIVRTFSMASIFGFKIEPGTLAHIKNYKRKLSKVAYERMRDEFFKILDNDKAVDYLKLMDEFDVLNKIIPEIEIMRAVKQGPYHHLDVWAHSLEALAQLEQLLCQLKSDKKIQDYLSCEITPGRTRRSLIKLAAVLHDVGKPETLVEKDGRTIFHGHERVGRDYVKVIAERLKLSNSEKDALGKIVFWHLRPGYLADVKAITERAIFRFFRDTGNESVSILLLSIADQRATRGPLTSNVSRKRHEKVSTDLIKRFFRKQKEKKLPRLISGDDLISKLKLEPSPLFKKILFEIEEAQAEGSIKTKKQALELAKKIAKDRA